MAQKVFPSRGDIAGCRQLGKQDVMASIVHIDFLSDETAMTQP